MKKIRKPGTHRSTEEKYRKIREFARSILLPSLQGIFGSSLSLDEITPSALAQAETWPSMYARLRAGVSQPGWVWRKELARFRKRPRRIELSIWFEGNLCGLALGRISDACVVASIHYLEGRPQNHPLSGQIALLATRYLEVVAVAIIATRYLEVVAVAIRARHVSLESPVPGLIAHYKELGFVHEVHKKGHIARLIKRVEAV
ncbi:MAG: hypothetical protein LWW92_13175 [Rhodocyclales bacterium]|nr:hypothetical protein [Rhodocyclales bacterium]